MAPLKKLPLTDPDNTRSASKAYRRSIRRKQVFLWGLVWLSLVLLLAGIMLGAKALSWQEVWTALFTPADSPDRHIVLHLRLPRLVAAVVSGSALALAGSVMQIVLRNPLGSPFTLGISNAAAFGAALAYLLLGNPEVLASATDSFKGLRYAWVTGFAFAWATAGAAFVLLIARKRGATPENMILGGIVINTFFMALTSVLQFFADEVRLGSIVFWSFGDLSKSSWSILLFQVMMITPIFLFFLKNSLKFNALDAGDQVAGSLGIAVARFRMLCIILTSVLTATIVAFYGIIAFTGLIIPHFVRILIGSNARFLIPASMALGSCFMLLCDMLSRSVFSPLVIPIGIITSVIGAPVFVLLLFNSNKKWSQ